MRGCALSVDFCCNVWAWRVAGSVGHGYHRGVDMLCHWVLYMPLDSLPPKGTDLTDTPCRLVNLVAEDNAIEDTIYHLHRALNSGRIDLEKFIRASSTVVAR